MSIKGNLTRIKETLNKDVTLIAVSKTKPLEALNEAYNCGVRDFGENKVQELLEKHENLPKDIRWHLIGHLQTNKVKYLVDKVFLIHSLDSIKLLHQIEKVYGTKDKIAKVLIQINIGRESNKTGIYEEDLYLLIEEIQKCSYVKVLGLMVVIPKGQESENQEFFKKTKSIWDKLKGNNYKNISMEYLSMGMTNDYEVALEVGSNMIRVGQGIFGKR